EPITEETYERTASSATSAADDDHGKIGGTTISYTNTLRKSGQFKSISFTDVPEKKEEKPISNFKSTSVNIIYTDKRLSIDSNANDVPPQNLPTVLIDNYRFNAFEDCEHNAIYSRGGALNNVDFLVKLNFMCQRITEGIAEAAAEDLTRIIKLRSNPRSRYFEDSYISELLDIGIPSVAPSPERYDTLNRVSL
uniref:Protein-tyrosine-phosphatase n=1 Tax=Bursaphelenchus xylophilus TaxID=6326 RepID=A0A1I7SND3_BURXY